MFRFAHPEYLFLLITIPVLIGLFIYTQYIRKKKIKLFGNPELLAELMPNAQISRCLIRPHEHGLNKIGHVAFFSPRSRAVWPVVIGES